MKKPIAVGIIRWRGGTADTRNLVLPVRRLIDLHAVRGDFQEVAKGVVIEILRMVVSLRESRDLVQVVIGERLVEISGVRSLGPLVLDQ